jgi:hypothetical protein
MARFLRAGLLLTAICPAAGLRADESRPPAGVERPLAEPGLAGFTKWLKKTGHDDPQGVFRLEDGVLRCGDEDMGYVATKQAYRDYQLSVEYRWGRKRPEPKSVRNTGVLLNGTGPDGSAKGVWMTSIECQLAQGCEGDLIVIPGTQADGSRFPATTTSLTRVADDKNTRWDPRGQPVTYSGKQFWSSRHEPFFKEDYDARGKDDVASPVGEWTKVECRCAGGRITVMINGHTVNECYDTVPASGKILLQAEGDEVFFRNLEIRPLPAD